MKGNPVPATVLVGGSQRGGASSSQSQVCSSKQEHRRFCIFCILNTHKLDKYQQYHTQKECRDWLLVLRYCYRCLLVGHQAHDCRQDTLPPPDMSCLQCEGPSVSLVRQVHSRKSWRTSPRKCTRIVKRLAKKERKS